MEVGEGKGSKVRRDIDAFKLWFDYGVDIDTWLSSPEFRQFSRDVLRDLKDPKEEARRISRADLERKRKDARKRRR